MLWYVIAWTSEQYQLPFDISAVPLHSSAEVLLQAKGKKIYVISIVCFMTNGVCDPW